MKIEMTINGASKALDVPPMKRMLDVLREDLGLVGAKEGCGEGECGACAVLMDEKLVDSCLVPAMQMAGSDILTIEGLGSPDDLDDLQNAFLDEGAVHCGFCTPGMIMAAYALLSHDLHPSEEEIRVALAGNICRCTGYEKICRAVAAAAERGYGERIKSRAVRHGDRKRPVFSGEERERFFSPSSLAEAFDVLRTSGDGEVTVLAGGTDIGPDMKGGRLVPAKVMDVFSVPELKGIEIVERGGSSYIRVGACSTNTDITGSPVTRKHLPALVTASLRSGALAMQNRATIGGNLCTASGAGDLPVVLLALGAKAVAASDSGERELDLEEFIVGYRKNSLRRGELLEEIRIPVPKDGSRQVFYKRGSRKALTLSRASLAFYAYCEEDRIVEFAAAAGSMSPVPIRLKNLNAAIPGARLCPRLPDEAARIAYDDVNPRKTPLYRKTMIANLTHRFFSELVSCRA